MIKAKALMLLLRGLICVIQRAQTTERIQIWFDIELKELMNSVNRLVNDIPSEKWERTGINGMPQTYPYHTLIA